MSQPSVIPTTIPSYQTSAISFMSLPKGIRFQIYHLLDRNRTNSPINIGLLSPTWKSPQAPVALMNTCSFIASELMPLHFSNCLVVIDTTTQHDLREDAFKWLKKVGNNTSTHFRRVRIIHRIVAKHNYEIEIDVTENKEVTVRELKGGMESFSTHLVDHRHEAYCLRVGVTMVEDRT
jgi:hypothetical protein